MIQSGRSRKERDYSKPSTDDFELIGQKADTSKMSLEQRKVYAAVTDALTKDVAELDMAGKLRLISSMADATKDESAVKNEYLHDKWVKERNELALMIAENDPNKDLSVCIKEANKAMSWPQPKL